MLIARSRKPAGFSLPAQGWMHGHGLPDRGARGSPAQTPLALEEPAAYTTATSRAP